MTDKRVSSFTEACQIISKWIKMNEEFTNPNGIVISGLFAEIMQKTKMIAVICGLEGHPSMKNSQVEENTN